MRQVRTVMEAQLTPTVHTIRRIPSVVVKRPLQRIQAVIMSRGTIRDIPWELGIVELILVGNVVVYWRVALVRMHMSREDEVDIVLQEYWSEDVLAYRANGR